MLFRSATLYMGETESVARAAAFAAIVVANLAMIFVSRHAVQTTGPGARRYHNKALYWITGLVLPALALCLYVPALTGLFRFAPPGAAVLLLAVGAGAGGIAAFHYARTWWVRRQVNS